MDNNRRKIRLIVLHCSATRIDGNYSVEDLRRDHTARGFRGIGYHFYIRTDGSLHKTREIEEIGAHVYGHNVNSIGICYEGGIGRDGQPADTRTVEQKHTMRTLLIALKHSYPEAAIVGHRDLSPDRNRDGKISPDEWIKLCPCFDAKQEYKQL